ncbi:MAG: DUF4258 domain-containing protein [Planctomycetota bacterium]|jgi:hypothetical protein|nr:DUF4258 domain-containing protein [Planctomycetota bacterium]MDP7248923.1 DUF4258 domain-containing protein [Planctomycetota bacterium]
MAKRIIFRVATPLGYNVTLLRNRWREIVRFKHPAVADCLDDVREALEAPELVRTSSKDDEVHLFYHSKGIGYLCVVTAIGTDDSRFVVTAYFARKPKEGNEIWKK